MVPSFSGSSSNTTSFLNFSGTEKVFSGVGRAGIVVERIDYIADSFSLCVSIAWTDRMFGGKTTVKEVAAKYIETILNGLQAFDMNPKKTPNTHRWRGKRRSSELSAFSLMFLSLLLKEKSKDQN